jgi:hypothetical protein
MTLVSVEHVRQRVQTDLTDVAIQDLIDNEESEVVRRYGAHGDGVISVTESREPTNCNLFLSRPFVSITSVTEYQTLGGSGAALTAAQYYAWPAQGRIERVPRGTAWGPLVTTVYVPVDDRAKRRRVIIELVRLAIEQPAMDAESVAGEYSFTAGDFEVKRRELYRRLTFQEI